MDPLVILPIAIFIIAFLYSSVGHAGGSGYIAVMSLFSMAPDSIKPISLTLNILVASIGTWQFWRAGHFRWHLFWPFALLSIPLAYVGGKLNIPADILKSLLGIVLLYSAGHLLMRPPKDSETKPPSLPTSIATGGLLGLLAGITGTGGGIFLTPLLLLLHWAKTKQASAVSALFILVNSISGLLGHLSSAKPYPHFTLSFLIFLVAVGIGGTAGSYLGSHRFNPVIIKRFLSAVLMIAGYKLLFT